MSDITNNALGALITDQISAVTALVDEVKTILTNSSGGSGNSTPASFVKPGS